MVAQGHAQINLSSRLSLDIGLGYGLKRFVELYQNNRSGFSPNGDEVPRFEIDYTHHGIDLPILMKYYFSGGNSGLYAALGINPGLQIRTVVNTDKIYPYDPYFGQEDIAYNDLQFNLSLQSALGVRHRLNDKMDFNVELYASLAPWFNSSRFIWMANSGLRAGLWF